MSSPEPTSISRRRALLLGGGLVAGTAVALTQPIAAVAEPVSAVADCRPRHRHHGHHASAAGHLPVAQMQAILQAEGTVSDGVLSIDISRDDIGDVAGPLGVTFTPAFEVDGTLTFQPLGGGRAFFNGDLPLLPSETNPFIDAIIRNGLIFQAFHQHYIEMTPNVWFIHWRGHGEALQLARAVKNVLDVTGTPFPQTPPSNPTTPLDDSRLAAILHGSAEVGDEGVVTVTVDRTDRITVDGVRLSPEANISTAVEFKPIGGSATNAWAAPDFSLTSAEVMPVVGLMRSHGWFQGCLYNQETDEYPQLYFDHMLKSGNAYELAAQIRRGLDLTASE